MTKAQHRIYITILFLVGITAFVSFLLHGYGYYITSEENRFFNPLHNSLKPNGLVGHGLGIIGSFMILVGVVVYMLRKRIKRWLRVGSLKHWLEMHIFLCSVGPILVLYHTAFKFGGIVAISFWSMVAVVISGVIGRFIYVQIPRSIVGQEFSLDELRKMNDEFTTRLKNDFKINDATILKLEKLRNVETYRTYTFTAIIKAVFKDQRINRRMLKSIKSDLVKNKIPRSSLKEILRICKSKLVLSRRINLLTSVQRIFRYWHAVHLPFALIMLFVMLIHVGVTVSLGYTWIF